MNVIVTAKEAIIRVQSLLLWTIVYVYIIMYRQSLLLVNVAYITRSQECIEPGTLLMKFINHNSKSRK